MQIEFAISVSGIVFVMFREKGVGCPHARMECTSRREAIRLVEHGFRAKGLEVDNFGELEGHKIVVRGWK